MPITSAASTNSANTWGRMPSAMSAWRRSRTWTFCSAHPFWAYPFSDISVVHNGQITNYWCKRRELERRGHRFMSNCDSELIAVYLADKIGKGSTLEDAMKDSIEELDGVFTYLVATADSLGMAKDVMAAKPMVLYEGRDCVALASEEVAIRSIFPSRNRYF